MYLNCARSNAVFLESPKPDSNPVENNNVRIPPDPRPQPHKVQHPWSRSRRRERSRWRQS